MVDKYNLASKANGGAFTTLTFKDEPEQTLIVCGTADEANVNREAAEALQQAIRASGSNVTVPIKSDREVTDDDLKTHHLLLIGRPGCNTVTARFAGELPVSFGPQSFVVRGEAYAARRQRGAGGGGEPVESALFRGGDRGPRAPPRRCGRRRCCWTNGGGGGRGAAARQAGAVADGPGEGPCL